MDIRSPLAGSVVAVTVEPGRSVRAGAVLAIVESMKMEHEVRAESDGEVAAVRVAAGDNVVGGEVLLSLRRPSDDKVAATGAERFAASSTLPTVTLASAAAAAATAPALRDDLLELRRREALTR